MNKKELNYLVKILHKVNYFASCSSGEIDWLLGKFTIKKYTKGRSIINKNSVGLHFYIIYKGKVEILFRKSFLRKRVLAHLEEGDFFGEISIILGIPTTAYVKAIKGTALFSLRREDFMDMLERNSELHEKIKDIALKRVDATRDQVQTQDESDNPPEEDEKEKPEEVTRRKIIKRIRYKWK